MMMLLRLRSAIDIMLILTTTIMANFSSIKKEKRKKALQDVSLDYYKVAAL
jgi:hypothetical protein